MRDPVCNLHILNTAHDSMPAQIHHALNANVLEETGKGSVAYVLSCAEGNCDLLECLLLMQHVHVQVRPTGLIRRP
jgi:hypothetical protein